MGLSQVCVVKTVLSHGGGDGGEIGKRMKLVIVLGIIYDG
jgi:hypothetical protein